MLPTFGATLLDPALLDLFWTMTVVGLLLLASTLTILILPWTDREIRAVHDEARGLLPVWRPRRAALPEAH